MNWGIPSPNGTRVITQEEHDHWIREFRKGDQDAIRILLALYKSLDFPSLPLEQSLVESVSKHILINATGWIGTRAPEPEPGHIFSTEAVASLRKVCRSAIPAEFA